MHLFLRVVLFLNTPLIQLFNYVFLRYLPVELLACRVLGWVKVGAVLVLYFVLIELHAPFLTLKVTLHMFKV